MSSDWKVDILEAKKLLCITFLLVFSSISYTQEIIELEKSLDSLKKLKESYQIKIKEVEGEYLKIETLLNQKRFEQNIGETYICMRNTGIYEKPGGLSMISAIKEKSKVIILEESGGYYKVTYGSVTGWVIKAALMSEVNYNRRNEAEKAKALAEIQNQKEIKKADSIASAKELQADKVALAERKTELIKKYGTEVAQKILAKKIWIGMTTEMALESWGEPDDNNRSVGSWGVHEQWIYDDTYVYFENGKLTSWQD
jgi:hypothetical protein